MPGEVYTVKMKINAQTLKNMLFPVIYAFASVCLLFYSFTQVDLNLTLSRVSIWQTIQKSFQYIGYFQRPWSTALYIGLLIVFYFLYFIVIYLAKRNRISRRQLWTIIITITVILIWSYPAFSYDMFNYMFTAKTVLIYHKNPYIVLPLQFAGIEPWLLFMRWIHLPSAYTPLWISLTLPAYVFGFGYFLLIMWNIKLLIALFYLATTWGIEKILLKTDARFSLTGVAIFALNPLIIIESLVSSHNDVVMMALAMFSILLYLKRRTMASFFILALSVALKLMTIFLIPVYFLRYRRDLAMAAITIGFILVLFQREVLPWYMVWLMPFVALLPEYSSLMLLAASLSFGLLLRYAPFLYFGNYNEPMPTVRYWVTIIPIAVCLFFLVLRQVVKSFALKSNREV